MATRDQSSDEQTLQQALFKLQFSISFRRTFLSSYLPEALHKKQRGLASSFLHKLRSDNIATCGGEKWLDL